VHRCLRRDVAERHAELILVHELGWDLPAQDAGEDVGRVVGQRAES